jgi:hypothetical protein
LERPENPEIVVGTADDFEAVGRGVV